MATAAATAKDTKAQAELHRRMLRQMLLVRRFEEKTAECYALGKIGGFCHLYIGQEAVGVGTLTALRDDDYVICSYREHGQALIRGIPPGAVMAELFGKATGCSGGKGGSMHLFDAARHFMGGHGIVGGHIPLAAGLAFAAKYRGTDQVCVCFFGEAAVNIGAFHEALNMASGRASSRNSRQELGTWRWPCRAISCPAAAIDAAIAGKRTTCSPTRKKVARASPSASRIAGVPSGCGPSSNVSATASARGMRSGMPSPAARRGRCAAGAGVSHSTRA